MNINQLAEQATEAEALNLYSQFARKFGWTGVLYIREDASDIWHDDDLALTDAEWEAVRTSQQWLRLGEYLSEDALQLARTAIAVAKASLGEYTVWVGGGEVNDHLLTQRAACVLANNYFNEGYDDVKVVNTTTNIVLSQFEWSK